MSKWSLIVFILIVLSSIIVILVRIHGKRENDRLEKGDLSADYFDIIEEN